MKEMLETLISKTAISKRIDEIAEQISIDFEGETLDIICVLKGGVVFMVDLARKLPMPVKYHFMDVKSYGDQTVSCGEIKIIKDLDEPIEGKNVLLVEDIIDSGRTHEYLPRAYKNGANDFEAREKMHNASCIAGLAFTNAFLGLNHSMAHKLGGEYHIPHGRANAVLLPYVIAYNGTKPTKFTIFPKYEKYIADEKYAKISRYLGLPASTTEEGVRSLVKAVRDLIKEVGTPSCIKDCGVDEKTFLAGVELLSDHAYEDQCTTANPRQPLVTEIEAIYKEAYYGK